MSVGAKHLVVVGDALLDRDVEGTVERLSPDAPVPVVDRPVERARPGGAGLAAALAASDGHTVTLVTALGDDAAGTVLRDLLGAANVAVVDVGLTAQTPEKVRVLADSRPLLRIDRGEREPSAVGPATDEARIVIDTADVVLVSDYGRGVAAEPGIRAVLERAARDRPVVWDPHPAGPAPVAGVALVTPNSSEAAVLAPVSDGGAGSVAAIDRGAALVAAWRCDAVAVTLSADGAMLVGRSGNPVLIPAPRTGGGDPCGAGDRFASRAAGALALGASTADAVERAVSAASGFVDAGGAASVRIGRRAMPAEPTGPLAMAGGALELAARERAAGRRVVATGGCFDLLHAGHVRMLQAARGLGDRLIVCLNSDRSVSALKGPERPLVAQAARAAVLEALECVDAVLVFDDDTPEAAIDRLRPDIWVKGGDYSADDLPEKAAVERHGGRVVVLPYVHGHSTTRLIEEAANRHAA